MTCQVRGCERPAEVRRVRLRMRPTEDGTPREASYVAEQCDEHWTETLKDLGAT